MRRVYGRGAVAVEAGGGVDGDVDVHDVAGGERPRVRDSVADALVDRRAARLAAQWGGGGGRLAFKVDSSRGGEARSVRMRHAIPRACSHAMCSLRMRRAIPSARFACATPSLGARFACATPSFRSPLGACSHSICSLRVRHAIPRSACSACAAPVLLIACSACATPSLVVLAPHVRRAIPRCVCASYLTLGKPR